MSGARYFTVFGAGVFYILRLMHRPPQIDESATAADDPIRTAGVVPGASMGEGSLEHAGEAGDTLADDAREGGGDRIESGDAEPVPQGS